GAEANDETAAVTPPIKTAAAILVRVLISSCGCSFGLGCHSGVRAIYPDGPAPSADSPLFSTSFPHCPPHCTGGSSRRPSPARRGASVTTSSVESLGIRMAPRNQTTGERMDAPEGTIGRRLSADESRVTADHAQVTPP